MKRLALVAAVFAVAACAKKEEAPAADTAMPAAAATDTGMKMDTAMKMDTTKAATKAATKTP